MVILNTGYGVKENVSRFDEEFTTQVLKNARSIKTWEVPNDLSDSLTIIMLSTLDTHVLRHLAGDNVSMSNIGDVQSRYQVFKYHEATGKAERVTLRHSDISNGELTLLGIVVNPKNGALYKVLRVSQADSTGFVSSSLIMSGLSHAERWCRAEEAAQEGGVYQALDWRTVSRICEATTTRVKPGKSVDQIKGNFEKLNYWVGRCTAELLLTPAPIRDVQPMTWESPIEDEPSPTVQKLPDFGAWA